MTIDTHTHAWIGWKEEEVREQFQMTGVDRIILAAAPLDHWGTDLNEGCARFIERFPDRAVGLIGIHPPDVEQSLRAVDTYHRKGFAGVKLMPTAGYYPDEERFRRIFEEVNARGMIVLTHCGWCSKGVKAQDLPQCTLYSHPYHIEPLIRQFPNTDFIFAHGGGRTSFQAAFELVSYHENAWVDTCPGQGTWVLQFAGHWLNMLKWDRVLFGTDTCYGLAPSVSQFRTTEGFVQRLLQQSGFSEHVEAVMHGNAERLLHKHGVELTT
jgi:predicted TIM-barrel fold metal-dependent hydrolase